MASQFISFRVFFLIMIFFLFFFFLFFVSFILLLQPFSVVLFRIQRAVNCVSCVSEKVHDDSYNREITGWNMDGTVVDNDVCVKMIGINVKHMSI